jgi:hypothetical protein
MAEKIPSHKECFECSSLIWMNCIEYEKIEKGRKEIIFSCFGCLSKPLFLKRKKRNLLNIYIFLSMNTYRKISIAALE